MRGAYEAWPGVLVGGCVLAVVDVARVLTAVVEGSLNIWDLAA